MSKKHVPWLPKLHLTKFRWQYEKTRQNPFIKHTCLRFQYRPSPVSYSYINEQNFSLKNKNICHSNFTIHEKYFTLNKEKHFPYKKMCLEIVNSHLVLYSGPPNQHTPLTTRYPSFRVVVNLKEHCMKNKIERKEPNKLSLYHLLSNLCERCSLCVNV